jgi:hypothetical protein
MVNRKEAAHVEAALSPHSPFCEASNAAVLAITRLKKEISTAHAA